METLLLVLIGGYGGGTARFFLSGVIARRVGETFPWGTLVVNITGCFLIGVLSGLARSAGGVFAEPWFGALFVTGFCGGYTTVSSFNLQTINLALDGQGRLALLNVLLSAGICMAAVAAGYRVLVS
jgi:fluoride exporter